MGRSSRIAKAAARGSAKAVTRGGAMAARGSAKAAWKGTKWTLNEAAGNHRRAEPRDRIIEREIVRERIIYVDRASGQELYDDDYDYDYRDVEFDSAEKKVSVKWGWVAVLVIIVIIMAAAQG